MLTNLYIGLLVFIFIADLLSNRVHDKTSTTNLFETFGYLMASTSFLSVVVRTAWSTAADRINEDLMFYSSIKPSAIVFGKLASGVVITLILMSVTMPFMTLTYSVGGLDLIVVMILFVEIFVIVQVLNALAILVATTSKIRFAPFLSLFVIAITFIILNYLKDAIINEWKNMERSEMLLEFIGLLVVELAVFALIVSVVIAKLSPENSNRLFPIRLTVTIIFILSVVCTLSELFLKPLIDVLPYIETACLGALLLLLLLVVCERDQWTPRIRRSLPKSLIFRIILFPFCTGSACGLVWIMLMMAILAWVDLAIFLPMNFNLNGKAESLFYYSTDKLWWRPQVAVLLFVFFFDLCVTAMLIRSWFCKELKGSEVWLLMICLMIFVSLGSIVIYFLWSIFYILLFGGESFFQLEHITGYDHWFDLYTNSLLSSIDPIIFLQKQIKSFLNIDSDPAAAPLSRYYGLFIWAIVLLCCLFVWYKQKLKDFSPYNINETMLYDEAVNAVH
jgi:hypothetical protein